MTQKETSDGLGIDQSQYSKMELGKTVISYKILGLLMKMGWDVDYLVTGKESARCPSKLSALIAQGEEKDRAELLNVVAWLLE
ncbi:MAG: helix-turn-helix domain-containing protein, partial [Lachnospiraceae bacterium]|nr:helix-turn-helix domain-containing protein [Lachnospiraceae bacterium]